VADEAKTIAKIRGLLAKAESTEFPDEAEQLTSKAMDLMVRYHIDEAQLRDSRGDTTAPSVVQFVIPVDAPYAKLKGPLLATIAQHFGGQTVTVPRAWGVSKARNSRGRRFPLWAHGTDVTVFALSSDRQAITVLFASLMVQATRQMARLTPPYNPSLRRREDTTAFLTSWFMGFIAGVDERFKQMRHEAVTEGDIGTGTELVLANDAARVAAAFTAAFPDTKPVRHTTRGSAYASGQSAGRNTDLNQSRIGARTALPRSR
jgi:hypothetical protein